MTSARLYLGVFVCFFLFVVSGWVRELKRIIKYYKVSKSTKSPISGGIGPLNLFAVKKLILKGKKKKKTREKRGEKKGKENKRERGGREGKRSNKEPAFVNSPISDGNGPDREFSDKPLKKRRYQLI